MQGDGVIPRDDGFNETSDSGESGMFDENMSDGESAGDSIAGRLEVDRRELSVPQPASMRWDLLLLGTLSASVVGFLVGAMLPYAWTELVHWTPFLLTSLLVGWLLAQTWFLVARMFEMGNRFTLGAGLAMVVFFGIAAPHQITFNRSYDATLRRIRQDAPVVSRSSTMFGAEQVVPMMTQEMLPRSVWDFLQRSAAGGRTIGPWTVRGGWAWASWAADAMMMIVGAMIATRRNAKNFDFCGACGRYYRRSADGETTLTRFRELVERCELPVALPGALATDSMADSAPGFTKGSLPADTVIHWSVRVCPGECGNGILRYESIVRRRAPTWLPGWAARLTTPFQPPVLEGKLYTCADSAAAILRMLRRRRK